MDTTKYKSYLTKFSTEQLKDILGRNLVDMLIEWTPGNEPLFTKAKLADMIITIYGFSILADKGFRGAFLQKFTEREVLSFREVLPRKYRDSTDLHEIIDTVAKVSWRKNDVTIHLLKIINIEDDIFPDTTTDEVAIQMLNAPDRFYELLDYQFVIKQKALNFLTAGVELNKMLIHMPTGTGKTKTAMHTIIHHYNFNLRKDGLIIWMAHTTELLHQAYETFISAWKHIGNGDVTVYKLWGSFNIDVPDEPFNGFLFCGFQKLMSVARSNPNLFSKLVCDCTLIVIDEAHKASAPETKSVIDGIMTKKSGMRDRALIGLTATPGRKIDDNTEINRLITMFDNKAITIDTEILNMVNLTKFKAQNTEPERDIIRYFQDREILARITRERLTYPNGLSETELQTIRIKATSNGYDDFTNEFLETIGRNKGRNMAILNKLIRLDQDKIPTIVFACSVEHGKLLSTALTLEGISNACVFGDMNSISRAQAIGRFKDRTDELNVLINYEVLTTGFDATNIKCVFITRPTQSVVLYSQMIGRGLRGVKMGGNAECLLVDIEDNLNKYNESMAFSYFDSYWNN